MNIETKFSLGDTVWYTSNERDVMLECPVCEGDKRLYTKSSAAIKCHNCWGEGKIEQDRFVVKSGKITFIEVKTFDVKAHKKEMPRIDSQFERYGIDGCSTLIRNYYSTKEEAEQIISDFNKYGYWNG